MRLVLVFLLLFGTAHAERLRAPDGTVKDYPADEADYLTRNGYSTIDSVRMRDSSGHTVDIYEDLVGEALARGYARMTEAEINAESEARGRESLAKLEREIEAGDESRDMRNALIAVGVMALLGFLYWRFAVRA